MLARNPFARRREMEMRRASDRRLTASGEDTSCWPRTPWAGPGMIWRIVVVVLVLCGVGVGLGFGLGAGGAGGLRTGAAGSNSLPMTVQRSVEAVWPSGPVTVMLLTSVGVIVVPSGLTTSSTLPPVTVVRVEPSP